MSLMATLFYKSSRKCPHCKSKIAAAATACPKCTRAVTPTQDLSFFKTAFVSLFAFGTLVNLVGEGGSTSPASVAKADEGAAFVKMESNLAAISRADSLAYDEWVGKTNRPVRDSALHRRVLELRLDSARRLLQPSGARKVPLSAFAHQQLAAMYEPMTDAQRVAKERVQSTINRITDAVSDSIARQERLEFAVDYERDLLRKNIDATVRATGRDATTLRVQWILASRPLAFQLAEDPGVNRRLSTLGFVKFVISDGDQSWSWDIK